MAIRPPRSGFSVSRRLSERARAAAADETFEPKIAGAGGFTGMIDALRGLVEQLSAAAQTAPHETDQPDNGAPKTVSFAGGKGRMVFGYTLRMGDEGVSAEPFGNIPPNGPPNASTSGPGQKNESPAAPAALQPIVEVFEDGESVVVVAELPGADPETIICRPDGKTLHIEATGVRRYRKDLALPVPVQGDGFQQSFRNGILEVRMNRSAAP
jgi:HSP20 family protein